MPVNQTALKIDPSKIPARPPVELEQVELGRVLQTLTEKGVRAVGELGAFTATLCGCPVVRLPEARRTTHQMAWIGDEGSAADVVSALSSGSCNGVMVMVPSDEDQSCWVFNVRGARVSGAMGGENLGSVASWVAAFLARHATLFASDFDDEDLSRDFIVEQLLESLMACDSYGGRIWFITGELEWSGHSLGSDGGSAIQQVVLEYARRTDEWPGLIGHLGGVSRIPVPIGEPASKLGHDGKPTLSSLRARLVWGLCDGTSSIRRLIQRSMLGEFRTCSILKGLMANGHVALVEGFEADTEETGGTPQDLSDFEIDSGAIVLPFERGDETPDADVAGPNEDQDEMEGVPSESPPLDDKSQTIIISDDLHRHAQVMTPEDDESDSIAPAPKLKSSSAIAIRKRFTLFGRALPLVVGAMLGGVGVMMFATSDDAPDDSLDTSAGAEPGASKLLDRGEGQPRVSPVVVQDPPDAEEDEIGANAALNDKNDDSLKNIETTPSPSSARKRRSRRKAQAARSRSQTQKDEGVAGEDGTNETHPALKADTEERRDESIPGVLTDTGVQSAVPSPTDAATGKENPPEVADREKNEHEDSPVDVPTEQPAHSPDTPTEPPTSENLDPEQSPSLMPGEPEPHDSVELQEPGMIPNPPTM